MLFRSTARHRTESPSGRKSAAPSSACSPPRTAPAVGCASTVGWSSPHCYFPFSPLLHRLRPRSSVATSRAYLRRIHKPPGNRSCQVARIRLGGGRPRHPPPAAPVVLGAHRKSVLRSEGDRSCVNTKLNQSAEETDCHTFTYPPLSSSPSSLLFLSILFPVPFSSD